ncbi:MAG: hypothetical protein WCT37_04570 [Patescibacteria group bacterium]|jgi:hypothetical protein
MIVACAYCGREIYQTADTQTGVSHGACSVCGEIEKAKVSKEDIKGSNFMSIILGRAREYIFSKTNESEKDGLLKLYREDMSSLVEPQGEVTYFRTEKKRLADAQEAQKTANDIVARTKAEIAKEKAEETAESATPPVDPGIKMK